MIVLKSKCHFRSFSPCVINVHNDHDDGPRGYNKVTIKYSLRFLVSCHNLAHSHMCMSQSETSSPSVNDSFYLSNKNSCNVTYLSTIMVQTTITVGQAG